MKSRPSKFFCVMASIFLIMVALNIHVCVKNSNAALPGEEHPVPLLEQLDKDPHPNPQNIIGQQPVIVGGETMYMMWHDHNHDGVADEQCLWRWDTEKQLIIKMWCGPVEAEGGEFK